MKHKARSVNRLIIVTDQSGHPKLSTHCSIKSCIYRAKDFQCTSIGLLVSINDSIFQPDFSIRILETVTQGTVAHYKPFGITIKGSVSDSTISGTTAIVKAIFPFIFCTACSAFSCRFKFIEETMLIFLVEPSFDSVITCQRINGKCFSSVISGLFTIGAVINIALPIG